ncbi:DUF485 domain-containing protein [Actinophytocola oryzae]|uniref:Uncharacterized membrane protein (DUF485 family) n=1 Tax=Actinophytocola oryzae TaxID=502181 RepID=A0A4R7UZ75_9PSEU|nr:DUF485 domain-containing protein [Actinophytocola oryzae]TDV42219.1 uncharacterized membrane protein (DUF485 family) [Actinophytocola oryzae]
MTQASAFSRAQEPEKYVAFEPLVNDFSSGFPDAENGEPDFTAIREHPDFVRIRRRLARFIFPASGLFLAWYLTYVLLAAYAHEFMAHRMFGSVTVGLLLGLSQFFTTVVIMLWYARFARTKVDPEIRELRRIAGETEQ